MSSEEVVLKRPADNAPCNDVRCKHAFGHHYTSHDGQVFGCSVSELPQTNTVAAREGKRISCRRSGFAVLARWAPREVAAVVRPTADREAKTTVPNLLGGRHG